MNASSTLTSTTISLSALSPRPALTRNLSSSSSVSTQGSSSRQSMRSQRNTSPPLLSLLKGRAVPPAPIPTRLASSKLILDESSPFHRRSVSVPTSLPSSALLIIKVEGVEVKDAAEAREERMKLEWAEKLLFGAGKRREGGS